MVWFGSVPNIIDNTEELTIKDRVVFHNSQALLIRKIRFLLKKTNENHHILTSYYIYFSNTTSHPSKLEELKMWIVKLPSRRSRLAWQNWNVYIHTAKSGWRKKWQQQQPAAAALGWFQKDSAKSVAAASSTSFLYMSRTFETQTECEYIQRTERGRKKISMLNLINFVFGSYALISTLLFLSAFFPWFQRFNGAVF